MFYVLFMFSSIKNDNVLNPTNVKIQLFKIGICDKTMNCSSKEIVKYIFYCYHLKIKYESSN